MRLQRLLWSDGLPLPLGIDPNPSMAAVCKWSVMFADALIDELKKSKTQVRVYNAMRITKKNIQKLKRLSDEQRKQQD